MYLLVLLSVMSFMENCFEAEGNKSIVSKHFLTCQMPLTRFVTISYCLDLKLWTFKFSADPVKMYCQDFICQIHFCDLLAIHCDVSKGSNGPIPFLQYTNHLHKNVANDDYFNFSCMLMTLIVWIWLVIFLIFCSFFLWLKRIDKDIIFSFYVVSNAMFLFN